MKKKAAGSPAWMATFADMMSLLMCFFVLLLSFSEMDVIKYQQIAGNMRDAFGVQGKTKDLEAPSGKSMEQGALAPKATEIEITDAPPSPGSPTEEEKKEKMTEQLEKIQEALAPDIKEGRLQVAGDDSQIMIRIREKGAFGSGSADVVPDFAPVLTRIANVLKDTNGRIAIGGHTDDRPIKTQRFRSNWELSAGRAVTVVHQVVESGDIDARRVEVRAYGDSLPLVPNDSAENRAQNRRVEIIVYQPEGDEPWLEPDEGMKQIQDGGAPAGDAPAADAAPAASG